MTTLNRHRADGARILIELLEAATSETAGAAVERQETWATRLQPLLDPDEWALLEPLSPFRPEEKINIQVSRISDLGGEWLEALHRQNAMLYRLNETILPARLVRKRQRMAATHEMDDHEAIAQMCKLIKSSEAKSAWDATSKVLDLADRTGGGIAMSVRKRLLRKYTDKKNNSALE